MVTIHLNPSIPLLCRPSVVHFLCFLSPLVIMPLLHTLSPISNYSLWEQDKDPDNFYEDDLLEVLEILNILLTFIGENGRNEGSFLPESSDIIGMGTPVPSGNTEQAHNESS